MPTEEIETEATKLHERFKALRELKGDSRQTFCNNILSFLGYDKNLDMDIADALFIKAIEKKFGKFNIEADITLMALGLLDGYSYNVYPTITKRREQFLKKSTYLIGYSSSDDENEEYAQKQGLNRLIKNDTKKLQYLAEFLIQYKGKVEELLNDIDNYMDDGVAILPTPSYIERKPLQDRIKSAVITFSISKKELFTTKSDIVINKNNEYEMTVDLPTDADLHTDVNLHKEGKISTLATVFFVLLFVSLSATIISYTHKDMLVKAQETDMEYQTKDDTIKNDEIFKQKLNAKSTAASFTENNYSVAPF